jgi:hypothetical protein
MSLVELPPSHRRPPAAARRGADSEFRAVTASPCGLRVRVTAGHDSWQVTVASCGHSCGRTQLDLNLKPEIQLDNLDSDLNLKPPEARAGRNSESDTASL